MNCFLLSFVAPGWPAEPCTRDTPQHALMGSWLYSIDDSLAVWAPHSRAAPLTQASESACFFLHGVCVGVSGRVCMHSRAYSRLKKTKKPQKVTLICSLISQNWVMVSHHKLSPTCLPKSHGDHQRRMIIADAEVTATMGQV